MKKFILIFIALILVIASLNAQGKFGFYTRSDTLFSGISGRELTPSEMRQEKGGWVKMFLSVYACCSIAYTGFTGRSLEKDAHRFVIRPM